MSDLTPQRTTTKDGLSVVYHRAKYQNYWVIRAWPSGDILHQVDNEKDAQKWINS